MWTKVPICSARKYTSICVVVEGALARHIYVSRFEGNRLVAIGLGDLHAAIPHPMIHVATPEENQAWLEFRFVGDECHIRLCLFDSFCADSV